MTTTPAINRHTQRVLQVGGATEPAARAICRGVQRYFAGLGMASVTELTLANGRRADVVALSTSGNVQIVEIKSSLVDFRTDQKWPEYRDYCDFLLFAVAPYFPVDVLPADCGLILADAYGAELIREAPHHPLSAARRKAMLLNFATTAAARLHVTTDPGFVRQF
jgi:hypothetical protein